MLIISVIVDEFSYDKQWANNGQLYRIITVNQPSDTETTAERISASLAGLGKELTHLYPEIEAFTTLSSTELTLKLDTANGDGVNIKSLSTEPSFFDLFTVPILKGNPQHFIEGKNNLVVTESFCDNYFRGQDIIGKSLFDLPGYGTESEEYIITGIVKDLPYNSHLRADALVLTKGWEAELNKAQYGYFVGQYIKTKPGTDMQTFSTKMNKWYERFMSEATTSLYRYEFQPIEDIYLKSPFDTYQPVRGNLRNLYIFAGIALLILFISCTNFINLSLTQNTKRLVETGVRKTFGAAKRQIIYQFLIENLLFFVAAFLAASFIYLLSVKPLEIFLEHALVYKIYDNLSLTASVITTWFIIGLCCGFFPAYIMSKRKLSPSLRNRFNLHGPNWQGNLIKSLITAQFTLSIIVMLAVLVVKLQMNLFASKELGYNPANLLRIDYVTWDGKGDSFKQELLNAPGILHASKALWSPGSSPGYMSREVVDPYKPNNKVKVNYIAGDADLAQTLQLKIETGRLLDASIAMDATDEDSLRKINDHEVTLRMLSQHSSLITRTAANRLGIKNLGLKDENTQTTPVGILDDFHNESFKNPINPTVIRAGLNIPSSNMLIRIEAGKEEIAINSVKTLWKEFYPNKLLKTDWVDEILAKQYKIETKLSQLLSLLGTVCLVLAIMGIFGMMMYIVERRVKEIGIRKVLGASTMNIIQLLSANFLKIIIIAFLLASPIAGWLMYQWLQDYAYRIELSWWIFIATGGIAVVVALTTIGFQTIKAALANPVDSLRNE